MTPRGGRGGRLGVVWDVLAEAWWELKRSRLRSYLALLGIAAGAMGLTVLVCALHLEESLRGEQDVTEVDIQMPGIEEYNRVAFRRSARLKRYELTPADGEALQQECPEVEQVIIRGVLMVDVRGKRWRQSALTSTNLTRPDLFRYALPAEDPSWTLAWGRVFTPQEMAAGRPVVMIDERTAAALWPKSERTQADGHLGSRYLHLDGLRFEVAGVLRLDRGHETILIPYTTMQRHFWNADWYLRALPKPGLARAAARHIDAVLMRRIGDPGCSFATTSGISYEELKVYLFFGIAGALVLLSAGAAVANKAYVDALERVPQFAVRRALGATRARLYAIVLTESALMCGFGCVYGGAAGWMVFASFSAEKWILRDLRFALPLASLGLVAAIVIAVGVLGSLQGAAVAANADPATALSKREVV